MEQKQASWDTKEVLQDICRENNIEELALDDEEFAQLCSLIEKTIERKNSIWQRINIVSAVTGMSLVTVVTTVRLPINPQVKLPILGVGSGVSLFGTFLMKYIYKISEVVELKRQILLGMREIMNETIRNPTEFRIENFRRILNKESIPFDSTHTKLGPRNPHTSVIPE